MKIGDVIKKYERIGNSLPGAMRSTAAEAFSDYHQKFPGLALTALKAIGDGDDALKEQFVATFSGAINGANMKFTLKDVGGPPGVMVAGAGTAAAVTDSDVEAWVRAGFADPKSDNREGKVIDGRDESVEKTARKMKGILIYAKDPKGAQLDARRKYLPFIEEFMLRTGLSGTIVDQWAFVVLKTWVSYVKLTWPGLLQAQIRTLLRS